MDRQQSFEAQTHARIGSFRFMTHDAPVQSERRKSAGAGSQWKRDAHVAADGQQLLGVQRSTAFTDIDHVTKAGLHARSHVFSAFFGLLHGTSSLSDSTIAAPLVEGQFLSV
jgi:hypothetical protein